MHRLLSLALVLTCAQALVLGLPRAAQAETTTSDASQPIAQATTKRVDLSTRVHVASSGWLAAVGNGRRAGVTGRSKHLDIVRLQLTGGCKKGIAYRTRLIGRGWQAWRRNGRAAGKKNARMEAIEIRLEGSAAETHDVYYRVYVQGIGWMAWTSNGKSTGTIGLKLNVEAIQVRIVGKGKSPSLAKGSYQGACVNTKAKRPAGMTVKLLHQMEHGYKPPMYQRCIVMHDTEEHRSFDAWGRDWIRRGGVGTQFMISRTGKIRQYASMDQICWHAGGATYERLNKKFNVVEYKAGAGSAMNQCSIGIELDHVAGEDYPEAQLDAIDRLIAYIDAYYGHECTILQHKDYRLINSDCSEEFAQYLRHLKKYRTTR